MKKKFCCASVFAALAIFGQITFANEPSEVIALWPGNAPGEKGNIGEERNLTKLTDHKVADKPVIRIGNVSKPTLSIYPPSEEKNTGSAVLVFPGGGYSILATDIEGTEICDWLNSLGVTAVLVKYRVPRRKNLEKHVAPLQDAQRAMSLVQHEAAKLKIDPHRIGVIGFSAGGHLAAALSTSVAQRTYPKIDAADDENCRPDFSLLIYPAYLTLTNDLTKLSPEVQVTTNHPPTFLAMAEDDPIHVENVLDYGFALKQAKVPFELHVYPNGGHGYGLRKTGNASASWPDRAAEWLRREGWLSKK